MNLTLHVWDELSTESYYRLLHRNKDCLDYSRATLTGACWFLMTLFAMDLATKSPMET
jgi:hypothetical protein